MVGEGEYFVREAAGGQRIASVILRTVAIPFWVVGMVSLVVATGWLLAPEPVRVLYWVELVSPLVLIGGSVVCSTMATVQTVLATYLSGWIPWTTRGSGLGWFVSSVARDVLLLSGLLVVAVSVLFLIFQGVDNRTGVALGLGLGAMVLGALANLIARRFGDTETPRGFNRA